MAKNLNHKCLKLVKEVAGVPNFRDADPVLRCLSANVGGKEQPTQIICRFLILLPSHFSGHEYSPLACEILLLQVIFLSLQRNDKSGKYLAKALITLAYLLCSTPSCMPYFNFF